MGDDEDEGGSEEPAERKPVLEARKGSRRVALHGQALDPKEALVASLLSQIEGNPLEVPLTRLLVEAPTAEAGSKQEAQPIVEAAMRSAATLVVAGDPAPDPVLESPPIISPPAAEADPGLSLNVFLMLLERSKRLRRPGWLRRALHPDLPPPPAPPPPPPHPLAEVAALDRAGRRLEAIALAREKALASKDPVIRDGLVALESRLVTSRAIDIVWRGSPARVVFGSQAVFGRLDVDFIVSHPGISRRHLLVARRDDRIIVRDLSSNRRTFLDGVAIHGEVAIGDGLTLVLAETVECNIAPYDDNAVRIEVGGRLSFLVFEGSLRLGSWRLERRPHGNAFTYALSSGEGAVMKLFSDSPPEYGDVSTVELSHGDAIKDADSVALRIA